MANIKIKRNDTYSDVLKTLDCNGDLVDASGWTIYFTVRSSIPATTIVDDTDAVISKTITGLASGEHTLTLTKTETDIAPGDYVFDIQIDYGDGTQKSSETGILVIQPDITRTGAS